MKKVGIITFHAAHNYGSNLQAYALHNVVEQLGCNCEIINFRTERQKDQYRPFTKRRGFKYVLKNGYFLLNYKSRKEKYERFEEFIAKNLHKSPKEYSSLEVLTENPPKYDYYISGSDQIWNTVPNDADDAYFLPFVKEGKRIAYAPSFGQLGTVGDKKRIGKYLNGYDVLSVRELFGQKLIEEITGKTAPIMPDPTMLLTKEDWDRLTPNRIVEKDYLFFYTLFATPEMIFMVKQISKELHLPVVISNVSNQYEIFSGFNKLKNVGPLEFLSLIKYAKFVCITSFHGMVFSILLRKPFFAINGIKDNRISTVLEYTGLIDRAITKEDLRSKLGNLKDIDYSNVDIKVKNMRERGIAFLKNALDLEE